jgi:hypothetical protein
VGTLRPIAIRAGLLAIFAVACSGPSDPVRATLDRIVRAADARDADAVFARVAAGFQGADGSGLAEARATVERYFAAYEVLDVKIRDVVVERAEGAARVRLRADLSGQPRKIGGLEGLVPSSSAYDFELRLVPEGDAWKVAWAQWNPAGGGGRND